jgi:hypothetical protein
MFQWIEGDAAKAPSGIVAEETRDKSVRCLVKCNCDDHREGPDRDHVEQHGKLLIHLL